ncbi:hypothetical protein A262_09291 [Pseudomonas syringae pv. actinidiae ICMP 19073]|nr:hypothetical protein A262_09291 [Pseudomonas syringae pv. actinidiae ICMP 19073]
MKPFITSIALTLAYISPESFAYTKASSPEGMHRSYEKNFKDLVLATCMYPRHKPHLAKNEDGV